MIQGFMLGTIFGIALEIICIAVITVREKNKERKEEYETGKRNRDNSAGLH